MTRTVLVIDDEPDLVRLVEYNLTREGYLVLRAGDGESGLRLARQHVPNVVLLDVMLPGIDGCEVLKRLRADPRAAAIPIIMLTARAQETDRVVGLELGADDYITKPFSVRELSARIKAVLRRLESASHPSERVSVGSLALDSGRRQATIGGRPLALTTTEFNLLRELARRPGRVYAREDLITAARGDDAVVTDRSVDVHVASIRHKLGRHGSMIETVRGAGYRLKEA